MISVYCHIHNHQLQTSVTSIIFKLERQHRVLLIALKNVFPNVPNLFKFRLFYTKIKGKTRRNIEWLKLTKIWLQSLALCGYNVKSIWARVTKLLLNNSSKKYLSNNSHFFEVWNIFDQDMQKKTELCADLLFIIPPPPIKVDFF